MGVIGSICCFAHLEFIPNTGDDSQSESRSMAPRRSARTMQKKKKKKRRQLGAKLTLQHARLCYPTM